MSLPPAPPATEPFQQELAKKWFSNRVWTDWLAKLRNLLVLNPFELALFTVATLPTTPTPRDGSMAFASDGRKSGEGAGAGTGVPVVFSNSQWRRVEDNAVVAA